MRPSPGGSFLSLLLLSGSLAFTQNSPNSSADALVAQAIGAFSSAPISQVQLNGTAKAYAGSSQPVGTFTATVKSTGESTLQLNLGDQSRTETSGTFGDAHGCTWNGADGVVNNSPIHNCLRSLDWLLPVLSLQSHQSALTIQIPTSATGLQLTIAQPVPLQGSPLAKTLMQKESTVLLTLDSSTSLPAQIDFDVHPEDDAGRDIPVLVRYSDYRQVSGVDAAVPHSEVPEQRPCA